MTQFCSHCGSKIDESWNVCPSCGTNLKGVELIPSPAVVPTYAAPQPIYMPQRAAPSSSSGLGTGSLVCGILSIFLIGFILGPIAIILGAACLSKEKGNGSAVAGLVTGIIGLAIWIFVLIAVLSWLSLLSQMPYYPYY